MAEIVEVSGMTNEEFLRAYAAAGRIGLAGGATLIDKMIARAQRHVDDDKRWGQWSHAFFFQGTRPDGEHWVIESDLDVHHKHVKLGVQENRVSKFYDTGFYSTLAVMDFGLEADQIARVVKAGLGMVAEHWRYSMRELVGTLIALRHATRESANKMSRDKCFYCSAFVSHLFREAGIDLAPGLHAKHITPEDLARTLVPHRMWVLKRDEVRASGPVGKLVAKVRERRKTRAIKKSARGGGGQN
jgi:hypothetical protein